MQQPGFGVDHQVVSQYAGQANGLSDELRGVGTALDAAAALPGNAFSTLGGEVGLAAAFAQAAKKQAASVHAATNGLDGLGRAVHNSVSGYQLREEDHQATIQRASKS